MYLCGNASQEVYEYATGEFGKELGQIAINAVTTAYYLIPNLAAFDFQTQAVYGLSVPWMDVVFSMLYALVYTAILLSLAIFAFNRRQLP